MQAVDETERRARMVMSQVAEPGDPDACRLVRDHSATDLLSRLRSELEIPHSPKVTAWAERASVAHHDDIARAADAVGARFACPGDADWDPALEDLRRLEDERGDRRGGAPFGLWLRGGGSLCELSRRCVAIVGSRASTAYGEHVAASLAFDSAERGFTVLSGGAYGIDAAAHRAVLARESYTIAVLAGGINRLYPAGNARLLKQVSERGLLVSEAAPGCTPTKSRFLVRNRLIAALSQGTVVVEAALRSGALNTARWALDLARGVMGGPRAGYLDCVGRCPRTPAPTGDATCHRRARGDRARVACWRGACPSQVGRGSRDRPLRSDQPAGSRRGAEVHAGAFGLDSTHCRGEQK